MSNDLNCWWQNNIYSVFFSSSQRRTSFSNGHKLTFLLNAFYLFPLILVVQTYCYTWNMKLFRPYVWFHLINFDIFFFLSSLVDIIVVVVAIAILLLPFSTDNSVMWFVFFNAWMQFPPNNIPLNMR